jgi:hypothetical protein
MDHISNRTKSPIGFERRVLRKIYGPTQDKDGTWRIKTNAELETLIKKENIVKIYVAEKTSTMHRFAPLLYFTCWLLLVSAVVCHLQGASGSV